MKRICFYILAIFLLAISCQDTMEKAEMYPIAGKWVALDDDGSVSHYIEFKTGKYYRYEPDKGKYFYSDQTIWNCSSSSNFVWIYEQWYSVFDGRLLCGEYSGAISYTDGILKIGSQEYYSFDLIKSVISFSSDSTSVAYSGGSFEVSYKVEKPGDGVNLNVKTDASWIKDVALVNNKLTFKVDENNSGSSRAGNVILTYGSVAVNHKVIQSYAAGITCEPTSTTCDYAAASKSFTYSILYPYEGESVRVSCSESWITNVVLTGTTVSFKVKENNSGRPRTGYIVLTYGAFVVNYKVLQAPCYTDLSSSQTANCYIVSNNGSYKFKTVQGNSSATVGSVSSAMVLWESFGTSAAPSEGDMIESVSYKDGYMMFQTADTFKEGNAVIAAKDASGKILWSWHIWFTDQPQGQVYYNNAGTMMDRNLGATSATPGDVGALGLLYQWGRKDPFLGSSSISSGTIAGATITWPSVVESTPNTGTIAYATANPTVFIWYNTSNNDWYYTGSSSTNSTRWTTSSSKKSVYDPCPAGWRVPDGGSNGVWLKANGSGSSFNVNYDSAHEGINFSGKFGADQTIWYPASGCGSNGGGSRFGVGEYGFYWSASDAYYLSINDYGNVDLSSRLMCVYGCSVRCLQE